MMGRRKWKSILVAPHGKNIKVRFKNKKTAIAHFAQDLSGESQPPFSGWFTAVKKDGELLYFSPIEEPIEWKYLNGR